MSDFYNFKINDIQGNLFDFSNLKGKKVLIVNTASECGFTPQFAAMQELYENTNRSNFEVIGIPSNDFGKQDPGSNAEILTFCTKNYGVEHIMLEKTNVLGPNAHPLFKWICKELDCVVTWNFQKFLIDENGQPVKTITPDDSPVCEKIMDWIENGK